MAPHPGSFILSPPVHPRHNSTRYWKPNGVQHMKYGVMLVLVSILLVSSTYAQEATVEPDTHLFFDDFNYQSSDDAAFTENGWIVRTADGWPGIPGAIWS